MEFLYSLEIHLINWFNQLIKTYTVFILLYYYIILFYYIIFEESGTFYLSMRSLHP